MFVQKTLGIVNCLSRSRIEKKQKTLEEKRDWKKFNRDKKNNPITSSSSLAQKRSTNQQPFLPNFFRDKRTHTRINWTKIPANNPHSSSWRRIIHSPIVVTTSPIRTHLRPKKEKKGRRKNEDSRTELLFVQRGVFPFHFLFFPSPWYFFYSSSSHALRARTHAAKHAPPHYDIACLPIEACELRPLSGAILLSDQHRTDSIRSFRLISRSWGERRFWMSRMKNIECWWSPFFSIKVVVLGCNGETFPRVEEDLHFGMEFNLGVDFNEENIL